MTLVQLSQMPSSSQEMCSTDILIVSEASPLHLTASLLARLFQHLLYFILLGN